MDFALDVLVALPVLQVNDSGELISGQYRHFWGLTCWDSMMNPSRSEMRSIVNMVMASTLAKYSWRPSGLNSGILSHRFRGGLRVRLCGRFWTGDNLLVVHGE